jgi:uncharacterized protein YfcZ (UPF0381/DUF406 family)
MEKTIPTESARLAAEIIAEFNATTALAALNAELTEQEERLDALSERAREMEEWHCQCEERIKALKEEYAHYL